MTNEAIECWLFGDSKTKVTIRTERGFFDVETGDFIFKEDFLIMLSSHGGHQITHEAYLRVEEGRKECPRRSLK
jgi:hypothetical protein